MLFILGGTLRAVGDRSSSLGKDKLVVLEELELLLEEEEKLELKKIPRNLGWNFDLMSFNFSNVDRHLQKPTPSMCLLLFPAQKMKKIII